MSNPRSESNLVNYEVVIDKQELMKTASSHIFTEITSLENGSLELSPEDKRITLQNILVSVDATLDAIELTRKEVFDAWRIIQHFQRRLGMKTLERFGATESPEKLAESIVKLSDASVKITFASFIVPSVFMASTALIASTSGIPASMRPDLTGWKIAQATLGMLIPPLMTLTGASRLFNFKSLEPLVKDMIQTGKIHGDDLKLGLFGIFRYANLERDAHREIGLPNSDEDYWSTIARRVQALVKRSATKKDAT